MNVSLRASIGIIGGSGFYDPALLTDPQEINKHTPYGETSDSIHVGKIGGKRVAFLPRHGRGHTIPPHKINSRANLWALKELGVERIFAPSAVGSLREDLPPGTVVFPDQFIDMTKNRCYTYYDGPKVAHFSAADPFCPELLIQLGRAAEEVGINYRVGGTYLCIEGPRFSTRAESELWRQFRAHVVGMTLVPEIVLARELSLCYCTLALVTDFDVWASSPVSAKEVVETQRKNVESAREILYKAVAASVEPRKCNCSRAGENAFVN